MTMATDIGAVRTNGVRGRYYFVSFTGRYACGRPETLLTR